MDTAYTGLFWNYVYVDRATGSVTPLVDYAQYADAPSAFNADKTGRSGIDLIPRTGVVTPDGGALVYLHHELEDAEGRISALPLPPRDAEPVLLASGAYHTPIPTSASISDDGTRALLFGYLLTLRQS